MKEIRSNEQIQASSESRKVEGYGVVYNSESVDLGGFTEIILPGAISEETIRNSDILFLLDHNRERGVLARSKNGSGSLKVEIDDKGVRYEFDAPLTALGDEILEGLRRQDINKCSFAFTVSKDSWVKREDGSILRTIEEIDKLYDISIVYNPAYEETCVVNKRGLDELEKKESEDDKSDDVESDDEKPEEVEEKSSDCDKESDDEERSESETDNKDESATEEKSDAESDDVKDEKDDESSDDTESETDTDTKEERNNLYIKDKNYITTNISMQKNKFSLVSAIRDIVNHRNLDEVTLNVIKEGRSAADKSGLSVNGQIVLPVEMREDPAPAPATVAANGIMATEPTMGKEAVPTETWDIIGALRDRLVLAQAGAQFITAQGNIDIPVYDGSSVYWESEVGEAQDGAGNFSKVSLSPKRLTAFVDISKQLLNQTSASVETMLREDLINAIGEKLQKTILGNGAGDNVTPKGLFNNVTADANAFAYGDAVDMEAALENANVYGDFAYVVSPSAKAVLRQTNVDKGSGKFVYENNEVLGINAYSTNGVVSKGVILGDFRQMVIANFGALDVTVDEVSRAHYGQIRLVVNFYVDYAVKRPSAFVKRILK